MFTDFARLSLMRTLKNVFAGSIEKAVKRGRLKCVFYF